MSVPPEFPPSGNDGELDALLGAYALDALDDDERARVDAYLDVNPHARHEVDELRESAASLALAPVDDMHAPTELWDRISSTIAEEPRAFTPLPARTPRTVSARAFTGLAVAAAVVVVLLATSVAVLSGRRSHSGDLAAGFDHAASQPGAREVALAGTQNPNVARVVVLPDGSGYLKNEGMKVLGSGEVYQLWAISTAGGTPISAGVLGADPSTVAFHTDPNVKTLGVTVEKAPGVVKSSQPMFASALVA